MTHIRCFFTGQQATAAVEFAIVIPFLAMLVAGMADFGLAFREYIVEQSALDAGELYALQQSGTITTSTEVNGFISNVQNFIINAAAGSGVTLSANNITVLWNNGGNFSSCYYVSGTNYPGTYTAAGANGASGCGSTNADGSEAGQFVSIRIAYTYHSLFGATSIYNWLAGNTHTIAGTIRIQ
jgi:Flp pilus assembly protein TadG